MKFQALLIKNVNQLSGDFANGTARMLFVSPTSDHFTAPYNSFLIEQTIGWAEKSFDLPSSSLPLVVPWHILGLLLIFSGALGIGACLFKWVSLRLRLLQLSRLVSFSIAATGIVIYELAASGIGSKEWASNLMLFCYALQVLTNYALKIKDNLGAKLLIFGLYSSFLTIALQLPSLIFNASIQILERPGYIFYLPLYLLQWPVFALYNCAQYVKVTWFSAYSLEFFPSYLFGMLVLLELILPGITLTGFQTIGVKVVKWLRQPFYFSGLGQISRSLGMMIFLLLLALIGVIYRQVQTGLVTELLNKGTSALQLFIQMLFLPAMLFVWGLRSRVFCYLESRCLEIYPNSNY